ncbi:MAG: PVC-type heme-binding CxxCH protein [Chthoniobacteraceae bacterium]
MIGSIRNVIVSGGAERRSRAERSETAYANAQPEGARRLARATDTSRLPWSIASACESGCLIPGHGRSAAMLHFWLGASMVTSWIKGGIWTWRRVVRLRCAALTMTGAMFLGAIGGAIAQPPAVDQNDPAAELAAFKVADGFEVNLFASEKDGIVNPIQMRWDARGRLWVIGSTTYPQIKPGELPDDKVWILEDQNRDGKADKVTVFADGLMVPTGLEMAESGLWNAGSGGAAIYLGEGTKLWRMEDADGDGKMDRKEVVLRGFGTGDNHQNINSFRWSPGGELMFSQGLHAHARIETRDGIVALGEAGLWRYRPRERRLDAFYGGQADPQNPWGWVWTDWGQPLVAAGNNGTYYYPAPEMIRGVQGGRRENIWPEGRGRKTSGPDIVGTAHFPDDWQGTLIAGGYINNAVWAMRIEDDGAGIRLVDRKPLLTSTHASFRPVDVKFGPDGALYICDWYNPIIGHYQASFRHPDRDKVHGRIWRVTAQGRPLVQPPPIAGADVAQLLTNLRSPERYVRYASKVELAGRPADEVVPALRAWWPRIEAGGASDAAIEHALFEALGVFAWVETPEPALLQRAVKSRQAGLRAFAAELLARWADRLPPTFDPLEVLAELAHDPEPRVRMAAVVAAGNIPRGESIVVVLSAADQPRDPTIDLALTSAAKALRPHWQPVLAAPNGTADWKPAWRASLVALSGDPQVAANFGSGDFLPKPAAFGKYRATREFVETLTADVKAKGDPKKGAAIYKRIGCVACHAVAGEGGNMGPPLDAIGSGHPIDFIIGAVLEPQREIKEGYECYDVETKNGGKFSGYWIAGTEEKRTLRDLVGGREVVMRDEEIVKREMRGSVMPANLTDPLTIEELRDLIRYLAELGKPK